MQMTISAKDYPALVLSYILRLMRDLFLKKISSSEMWHSMEQLPAKHHSWKAGERLLSQFRRACGSEGVGVMAVNI
jgi:hypothetical protein